MARKGRQTKSFMVIRRGPLFADEFNCSLDAWQLSREAMLEARFEKQGKVDRKGTKCNKLKPCHLMHVFIVQFLCTCTSAFT